MRSDELKLLWTEIRRRILSGRFGFVLVALTFFVWGVTDQMMVFSGATGVGYNAWDVILGVFGNTENAFVSTLAFPLLLVFLLGSSVQEDVVSGYSLVVQARLSRKNAYWWIKVLSILVVIAVIMGALHFISLLLGAVRGFSLFPIVLSPAGGHPDAWTIARGAPPIYYSLPEGADVAVHGLLTVSYFVFAYFAVVMFVVGLTIRAKNLYTPIAFGMLVFSSQWAASYAASGWWSHLNLVTVLTESSHRKLPAIDQPMLGVQPWSYSIMLLSGYMVVGLIAGALLTPTRVAGVGPKSARRLRRTPASAATCILLLVGAMSLTGCNSMLPEGVGYEQFIGETMPDVQYVELDDLSASDINYLTTVASKTVELGDAVNDMQVLFGAKHLHDSNEEVAYLLEQRLSRIEGVLTDIRTLETPPALKDWYRYQYEPGLDQLQYVIDHLGPLYESGDHVAVRMCMRRVRTASDYLFAAGQTIAPFAPTAAIGVEAGTEGGETERF